MEQNNFNLTESEALKLLEEMNQSHIIDRYSKSTEEEKFKLILQIQQLESSYPGGLKHYVERARKLLQDSKNQVNPYADYKPSIPKGEVMKVGSNDYFLLEASGMELLRDTAFVLVAGGLGERLGYNDIKIGIPSELITLRTFFSIYVDYLKAFESRIKSSQSVDANWFIPLAIMTSDDTEQKTIQLLGENSNFGLKENQIKIIKQDKVPALINNDCHFALEGKSLVIDTKPHGHGDVHHLLHSRGILSDWVDMKKKYVVFFQDTNALVFNCIPSALGVSQSHGFKMNTIAIPRFPGEAVGGICNLTSETTGHSLTLNVEYNQLDPLLRDKYNPNGDVANEQGLSDFPGNTNVLIFELKSYYDTLVVSNGVYPEFVNPKYADESRTVFKSPTRVECMMSDFPKLFRCNENVGFTMYDRWFCFSTCKNNLKDGIDKLKKGGVPETAFSVEQDIFATNLRLLQMVGKVEVVGGELRCVDVGGCEVKFGPKIVTYPNFACNLAELKNKIKGKIRITSDSTLILQGEGLEFEREDVIDGFCQIKDARVVLEEKKHQYVSLVSGEGENYEQIRGYRCTIK